MDVLHSKFCQVSRLLPESLLEDVLLSLPAKLYYNAAREMISNANCSQYFFMLKELKEDVRARYKKTQQAPDSQVEEDLFPKRADQAHLSSIQMVLMFFAAKLFVGIKPSSPSHKPGGSKVTVDKILPILSHFAVLWYAKDCVSLNSSTYCEQLKSNQFFQKRVASRIFLSSLIEHEHMFEGEPISE